MEITSKFVSAKKTTCEVKF